LRSVRNPSRRLPALAVLLSIPLLLGLAGSPTPAATPAPTVSTVPAVLPALPAINAYDDAPRLYAAAAAALRQRDCAGAERALAPLLAAPKPQVTVARLVSGLYAHSCEEIGLAEERLFAAPDPGGPLEDWRLFILSDSSAANGHMLLAQAALAKLLGDYPASPLVPRALVKAADLAWRQGNARRALELVQKGRDGLSGEAATQLESLAWEIATGANDLAGEAEAARRLLTHSPTAAARLQVVDHFRRPDGAIPWADLLSADQLKRRSEALFGLDLGDNALATLDMVRAHDRDLDWYAQKADVLTREHRGMEALTLLTPISGSDPRQRVKLEWARARAAADVAQAHRGRANLPARERADFRAIAEQHLRKVVELGAEPGLAIRALRDLYADLVESDLFDRAIETLRELRRFDPADTTGAANLWNLGWREYDRRNFTGAVGYWTELADLYPEDGNARRGRYWTARAFEALGESERAQQLYDQLTAADTTDFYRRNALVRLKRRAPRAAAAEQAIEPWPDDPALRRARLLTDLGLDDLASSEIELESGKAKPRPAAALNALVLARKGERRKSMLAIRGAFPALGGPYQATLPDLARHLYYPLDYQDTIRGWASRNRLPAPLVFGIVRQESGFDAHATSTAGARGLMQLMPGTARELAARFGLGFSRDRLTDPSYNLQLGTTYFRQVLSMFDDNLELALAGYNGGPYRIKRLWRERRSGELDHFLEGLDLEESKTYVKRILVLSDSYRQLYPTAG